jgi:hypothetical protein
MARRESDLLDRMQEAEADRLLREAGFGELTHDAEASQSRRDALRTVSINHKKLAADLQVYQDAGWTWDDVRLMAGGAQLTGRQWQSLFYWFEYRWTLVQIGDKLRCHRDTVRRDIKAAMTAIRIEAMKNPYHDTWMREVMLQVFRLKILKLAGTLK